MSSSFSSSPSSTMCPIGGPAGMALGPVLSRTFFGSFVDLEARPNQHSLLDLMFDPAGMRLFVEECARLSCGAPIESWH